MDMYSVRKNPLAVIIVFVAVIASLAVASYGTLVLVSGSDDYEGSAVDTYEVDESIEHGAPVEQSAPSLEAMVPAALPEPAFVSVEDVPEPALAQDSTEFDQDHDCDAFFAEMDVRYDANIVRFAEVLDSFGVAHELVVDDDYSYVDVDYGDPVVDAISNSFWMQVSEEDETLYDHPCFAEGEFEGCEEGEFSDYDMTEEQREEIRADWVEENDALAVAFAEAGIDFAWETDEYFEVDVMTWDHEDDAAMDVYGAVFAELYPEFAIEIEMEGYGAEMEAFEADSEQRQVRIEAFVAALAEAGVDHEVTNEYDWMTVTFDIDDERAIDVVAALG